MVNSVATVLTACGIETWIITTTLFVVCSLQQCLPLAVLKQAIFTTKPVVIMPCCNSAYRLRYWNFATLCASSESSPVATVLTACGIETWKIPRAKPNYWRLQQCLPLAVLKLTIPGTQGVQGKRCNSAYRLRYWNQLYFLGSFRLRYELQQCLPLAVLKLMRKILLLSASSGSLQQCLPLAVLKPSRPSSVLASTLAGCNSAYRLRYWNPHQLRLNPLFRRVATVLTACGIETK